MSKLNTKIIQSDINLEGLFIRFEITNKSNQVIYLLKRNTPLEGLKSDCLKITLNGKPIVYDGFLVKRTYPKPSEFVEINPGQTVSNVVNVSKAYNTSKPGTYKIQFDDKNLVILPERPGVAVALEFKAMNQWSAIKVSNQSATIKGVTQISQPTVGQLNRNNFKKKAIKLASTSKKRIKAPVIMNSTDAQKKQILKAHKSALKYSRKAQKSISATELYETWFGKYTQSRAKKVDIVFSNIIDRFLSVTFTYIVGGDDCDESTIAYTTTGGSTIWLCESFWELPEDGFTSKAGTFVHEHSHASGDTDDFEYYSAECRVLAAKFPAKAVKNADNYEFFSESFFQ